MITTNSSPPSRQARSTARTLVASRTANSRSTSSPTSWPKVSLTRLKWSMSMTSAATGPPPPTPARFTMAPSWPDM